MWCHLYRPGAVLGRERRRGKGIADFDNGPIQFNEIDYLYLSSLAGDYSNKGVDEAGESF